MNKKKLIIKNTISIDKKIKNKLFNIFATYKTLLERRFLDIFENFSKKIRLNYLFCLTAYTSTLFNYKSFRSKCKSQLRSPINSKKIWRAIIVIVNFTELTRVLTLFKVINTLNKDLSLR